MAFRSYTMKNILASLLCLLWSVNAWAAQPTFDARSISTCTVCSVNSFSHSIGFGCTNDIVIVYNLFSNDASISSVTVGGNATTPIATDTNFQSGGWSIDMQRKVGAS